MACCLRREESAVEEEETEEAYDLGGVVAELLRGLKVIEEVSLAIRLLNVVRIILNVG